MKIVMFPRIEAEIVPDFSCLFLSAFTLFLLNFGMSKRFFFIFGGGTWGWTSVHFTIGPVSLDM
jgi:hypothetical protein